MFPRNVEACRYATPEEGELLAQLKTVGEEWDEVNGRYAAIENQVKLAIGEGEGLIFGKAKVTWKRCVDSVGPKWQEIAESMGATPELIKAHIGVTKQGSRRMHCSFGK